MDLAYGLYMAEQEGYLNSREQAVENIINDIKKYPDEVIPKIVFISICQRNGLSYDSLTNEELIKINEKIKVKEKKDNG